MEIDPVTGLPKDLVSFEEIVKEDQEITVSMIKKKFGKKYTVIEGFADKGIQSRDILKALKSKFACGGSMKDNRIELQGDYRPKITPVLEELGFARENITVLSR
ncbi:hypothetical protein AUJ68_05800 [Candidatus Woesearchaeota archaeon CG1_02_57_44]|nr:MAG: hypothetical protein AUJ68_05800 [Candidatus Woesearchaeota archaeon CG1_02_57_44]